MDTKKKKKCNLLRRPDLQSGKLQSLMAASILGVRNHRTIPRAFFFRRGPIHVTPRRISQTRHSDSNRLLRRLLGNDGRRDGLRGDLHTESWAHLF